MRKGLMFLLGIVSFLGINTVSAEEIKLNYNGNINQIKPYIDEIGYDSLNNAINEIIQYHDDNLSENRPYYFISLYYHNVYQKFMVVLTALPTNYADEYFWNFDQSGESSYLINNTYMDEEYYQYYYDFTDNTIKSYGFYNNDFNLFTVDLDINPYYPYNYYYSNFDFYYKGTLLGESTLTDLSPSDTLYFPSHSDSTQYFSAFANQDFLISPYYLYDNNDSFEPEDSKYIEINLNEYPYVVLSLKDYTPRDTFTTAIYVKGQLCPTTLYNYGTEEKKDYVSGWQSPPCGDYTEDFILHLNYIRSEDITNHAIYYLTTYDKSKPNQIMVDSSVYNITYITSENENNPSVTINGKNYNTIPYSNLTDTSINTEINGIDPTWSCAKYDTNCIMNSSKIDINDLFSKPLEMLKSVWSAIASIFTLITEFILLLPPTMQGFLYTAFGISIILGIIKILL